jgi:nucleotide-binding universal stress UspA family protein
VTIYAQEVGGVWNTLALPITEIGRVIVACDDTPTGWAALAWAEAECAAGPDDQRLVLCRVYPSRTGGTLLLPPIAMASIELVDPVFARQIHDARSRVGGERVEVVIRLGDVADQLLDIAEPSDILVTAAPTLGATGLAVTVGARAGGTVIAVRPTEMRSSTPRSNATGPFAGHVVVAVDGARDAGPIRFAFEYAARHGKPVTAIHAHEPDAGGLWTDDTFMELHTLGREFGLDMLDAAIADMNAKHPAVPVSRAIMHERATASLVRASEGAVLLVVGDRGRAAIARQLLGSVSRHVLMHARCTVAVVHGAAEHVSERTPVTAASTTKSRYAARTRRAIAPALEGTQQ